MRVISDTKLGTNFMNFMSELFLVLILPIGFLLACFLTNIKYARKRDRAKNRKRD